MKRRACYCIIAVIFLLSWISTAGAITIGFQPSAQSVAIGDSVDVDITVSGLEAGGLDEIVSAYSLVIGYDASILSATGATFGSSLGFSFSSSDLAYDTGEVLISELSLSPDDELAALQPDSFVLATLSFDATGQGTSSLEFLDYIQFGTNFGIDVKGRSVGYVPQVLNLTADSGSIQVDGGPPAIPEPGAVFLLGSGLFFCGLKARRKRRQP